MYFRVFLTLCSGFVHFQLDFMVSGHSSPLSVLFEVKSMAKPPAAVILTSHALCIMMGVAPNKVKAPDGKGKVDDWWDPAKKNLSRRALGLALKKQILFSDTFVGTGALTFWLYQVGCTISDVQFRFYQYI